jgi:RNA polymerase sigma factor (sigma-70 family)
MGSRHIINRSTLVVSSERLNDDQLLRRFLEDGDQDAFAAIVSRHGPRVLGVCRQVLGRSTDVDDAFQATFLLLARKAGSIRDRAALGHWLHGVAHRIAVRSKLGSLRRLSRVQPGFDPAAPPTEDDLDRREVRQVLHEEIDRLPERLRQPVLLCYLEGLTNSEAAVLLGCPSSTLKARLAKAREDLRGRLERRGLALSMMLLILMLSGTADAEVVSARLASMTAAAAASTRSTRRAIAPNGPWMGRARGRLLVAILVINLVATFAALSHASAGLPRWMAWLVDAARKACH